MIDWKSLVPSVTRWVIATLLTVIATKWADSAEVVRRLMAGDTVPLWGGAINLSVAQMQLWFTTGVIALVGAILGWIHKIRLKRERNIALQLPKGATKADLKAVAEESGTLSAEPDPAAVREMTSSLKMSGKI